MARFGQALKASKPPQQLSKALYNLTTLRSSFEGVLLAWPWYLPRPHKLFLLGFETAMWHVLGRPQKPQNLRSSFRRPYNPHNPPQHLSKACRLLGHGTSLGPTSCFYWASKLLCGTFWTGLKSHKTSAAAFESLITSQTSAAPFEGVPLAWPWYLPRPHKLFLLGLRTALHVLAAFLLGFELLCGTFWAGLKSLKTSAAAFEGLITSQPSAGAFEGVPLAWPWYLPRPHKLFLLRFETAMWHVLGRP